MFLAAAGGVYSFSKAAAANLRETEDTWNTTIAGALAGATLGLRSTSEWNWIYDNDRNTDAMFPSHEVPPDCRLRCGILGGHVGG